MRPTLGGKWGAVASLPFMDPLPSSLQGVHYSYLELSPGEHVQEGDPRFRSALTAHPVRDPVHMYRLHKAFARAELERTYQEIQELQVWSRPWGTEGTRPKMPEIPGRSKLALDSEETSFLVPVCFCFPEKPL